MDGLGKRLFWIGRINSRLGQILKPAHDAHVLLGIGRRQHFGLPEELPATRATGNLEGSGTRKNAPCLGMIVGAALTPSRGSAVRGAVCRRLWAT